MSHIKKPLKKIIETLKGGGALSHSHAFNITSYWGMIGVFGERGGGLVCVCVCARGVCVWGGCHLAFV